MNADALRRHPVVMTVLITCKKNPKILKEMNVCPIGHRDVQSIYAKLKIYFTWLGMFHDVQDYIRKCDICKKNKFTGPHVKTPFQETDNQYQPWNKLCLDIVRPSPMTDEGYKYILTCQDNLSKYL